MKNRRHSCGRLKPMECMENEAYGTYKKSRNISTVIKKYAYMVKKEDRIYCDNVPPGQNLVPESTNQMEEAGGGRQGRAECCEKLRKLL